MRSWGLGGEAAPLDLVNLMQQVRQRWPSCAHVCQHFVLSASLAVQTFPNLLGPVNMYGPTEVTAVTVQHVFAQAPRLVVIGRPDANVHTYIIDSRLNPVPVGVPGELVLSGPRLAIGENAMSALLDASRMLCHQNASRVQVM